MPLAVRGPINIVYHSIVTSLCLVERSGNEMTSHRKEAIRQIEM